MPDTNTFDHLYDNDLIDLTIDLINSNKISLSICQVQRDELDAISDQTKKSQIDLIPVSQIPSSIGFIAPIGRYTRGFIGSKIGEFKHVNEQDKELVEPFKKLPTETHPSGNAGDITIVFTALKEGFDYLISNDDEVNTIFQGMHSLSPETQFLDNQLFENFLRDL